MVLPRWIPFAVAFWVIAFGLLRLSMALRRSDGDQNARPKRGYYGRTRLSHALYGVAYLALGGFCIALGLGYRLRF